MNEFGRRPSYERALDADVARLTVDGTVMTFEVIESHGTRPPPMLSPRVLRLGAHESRTQGTVPRLALVELSGGVKTKRYAWRVKPSELRQNRSLM